MGCGGSKDQVVVTFPIQDSNRVDNNASYENWSKQIRGQGVTICHPLDVAEALKVVNWAVANKKVVRVLGHQHNWSPITIAPQDGEKAGDTVLIQLDKLDKKFAVVEKDDRFGGKSTATICLGVPQVEFLTLLENAVRSEGPPTAAPGYGVTHCPAPDQITMGGMSCINGHGTAVRTKGEAELLGERTYGSWSNRIVAIKAVVYDETLKEYVEKEITRSTNGGADIAPFLTCVGYGFLTYATFQVEPNYYLRCRSFLGIDWETMFAAPKEDGTPKERSMAWFIERHGRAEAIWFPFTEKPWLKVWSVTSSEPKKNSKRVHSPCNYPFSDKLPDVMTDLVNLVSGAWGSEVVRVGINKAINENDDKVPPNCDPHAARCEKLGVKFSDSEIGIADGDDEATQVSKRNLFAQKKLEETEQGKAYVAHHVALVADFDKVSKGEIERIPEEGIVENFEAEEGDPLAGADEGLIASGSFWDILTLGKFGGATPLFDRTMYSVTLNGLKKDHSYDIWGPSKDTLIYVRDTTIKVTANGYAILCTRKHTAVVMHAFAQLYNKMLKEYQLTRLLNAFPIAMPLEIRVTGLDDPALIGDGKGQSPWLSALYVSDEDKLKYDSCLWLDVLSMPGNFGAVEFYAQMETAMLNDPVFNSDHAKFRPEWSKGWGYDKEHGPWYSERLLQHTRAGLPKWNEAMNALATADKQKIFTNPWMKNFFRPVDKNGEGTKDPS
jgi:hypothetical protein